MSSAGSRPARMSGRSRSGRPSGPGRWSCRRRRSCGRPSASRPGPWARSAWPRPGRGFRCRARGWRSRRPRSGRRRLGVLGLADVRSLAGQPEDVVLQPISRAMSTQRLARSRAYWRSAGLLAVKPRRWCGGLPRAGRDDLDEEALAVEHLLDLGDSLAACWASRDRPARCRRRGTARRRNRVPCTRACWRTPFPCGRAGQRGRRPC